MAVPGEHPFQKHDEHLGEGDILVDGPVLRWKRGQPTFGKGRIIVTSHSCACEDYDRAIAAGRTAAARKIMIMVAPLQSAKDFPEANHEPLKRGQYYDHFYLYGDGAQLQDQIVNFTREFHVPAATLVECKKIARLATWQWNRLLVHLTVSRYHQPPETIFGNVETEIDSDAA